MSERETILHEVLAKFLELKADPSEMITWLASQRNGRTRVMADEVVARNRRAAIPPSLITAQEVMGAEQVRRQVAERIAIFNLMVEDEPETAPPTIDCGTLLPLLGYVDALQGEVRRLKEACERQADVATTQERFAKHVQERVLELLAANVTDEPGTDSVVLRIGRAVQIRFNLVLASRGEAIYYTLRQWWQELIEPHESPVKADVWRPRQPVPVEPSAMMAPPLPQFPQR